MPPVKAAWCCQDVRGFRYAGDMRSLGQWHQAERGPHDLRADDGAHGPGAVAVVLRVVRGVDRTVRVDDGLIERDVALDPAGTDSAETARLGPDEPGIARPVGGAHIELVSGADDPDRHVGTQRSVGSPRGDLQLFGAADAVE